MMWRYLDNFSSGSVCLVLASELYDEGDYYRDYDVFLTAVATRRDEPDHPGSGSYG
ncbi:MAG: FdtA/QdtA family cupin domain-containing protein [Magnetococcus sp. YQC-9]